MAETVKQNSGQLVDPGQKKQGIWLEVEEVLFERRRAKGSLCSVRFKADREEPRPSWWPVSPDALSTSTGDPALETYKAILSEQDKKRLVLAWLALDPQRTYLECGAFRFLPSEMISR